MLGNVPGQPALGKVPGQPALGNVPGQLVLGKINQLLTKITSFGIQS